MLPKRLRFKRQHTRETAVTTQSVEDRNEAEAAEAVVDLNEEKKIEPDETAQRGVKNVEAITLSWTKPSLVMVYLSMFMLYFTNAFQASITANLTAYVLSGFEAHSLIPVIYIVSNSMCAVAYLPVAKLLDVWGRPQGFLVMAGMATLGLVLMAVTNGVSTFCAAQVFYSVGFTGTIFSIDVITADTSSLRDRGLAYAFTSSPYIITALAGPAAAEGFYEKISWRWAFGCFAIILPFVAAPLFVTLLLNQRKAKKQGLLVKSPTGRTMIESIWHYVVEFDAAGVIMLGAGLTLFLLPFSLADSTANSWRSASVISMLVIGFVLLLVFPFFERYVAKKPFIPYNLLISRTILGTVILDATWQVAYYCWASYFSSYLQVVYNLTITQAGWITGIFDIISGCWLLFIGYVIRRTGYFKWLLLWAVPLYTLAVGLMIYFRQPHTNIGFIIMCQIFIAFAGGTMILVQQVAVLSVAEHGDVAALLALLGLFGYIGGAIGNSVSGAIWTNSLPEALQRLLPDTVKLEWEEIYGDLSKQLSYEPGSPARDAIIESYAIAQKRMLIAGTCVMILAMIAVLFIRNVKVNKQQMKGLVF